MKRIIAFQGIPCAVYTTEKTVVAPGGPDLDPETVVYAAWRWLYHCRPLFRPLTTLCLAFRRDMVRTKSFRMEVSLPARAAELPSSLWLHLQLVLSCDGEWLERVSFSSRPAQRNLPGRMRRVVFH